jgi:6-pyruvoyltetrahydropterin/6-carboxytetrahydropterin synthase
MTEMTGKGSFYRLHIRKEALKFSAAHMTVFPDGTKESLHGHNYRTELTVEFDTQSLDQMIAFSEFKKGMKRICASWDEKVILAANCPHMKIVSDSAKEIEFTLCGKRYALPKDETILLPIDNVVTEALAREFLVQLVAELDPRILRAPVTLLELKVEEITGQGASYVWKP